MPTTQTPCTPGALPTPAAADYLGIRAQTLKNWRSLDAADRDAGLDTPSRGPRYVRLGSGRTIVYRVADLDDYLAERVVGDAG
ncbi:MAG: helix-turn-helix transcriptional regulator [Corynebacterium sp.]|uniref:helix-turn-helix transcriptional regulator n=1 Tax=Corynebacterium sp. TaxID=1720 RepID=UPI003F010089